MNHVADARSSMVASAIKAAVNGIRVVDVRNGEMTVMVAHSNGVVRANVVHQVHRCSGPIGLRHRAGNRNG